ncbi:hypothetical protein HMPREF1872_00547 [Amygdalobacter nucleatus]|uniref:Uncharacterized protein n=1 Tax=Amygdalobacter nucleatus TaxID=3029274 RepID=A0A133YFM2_9FIRM|nr:hypothetical protein HMPREF1872_00547 [Amygdalobacter nucleatus]
MKDKIYAFSQFCSNFFNIPNKTKQRHILKVSKAIFRNLQIEC